MEMCTTPYMKKIFLKNVEKRKKIKKHKQINNQCIFSFEYRIGRIAHLVLIE